MIRVESGGDPCAISPKGALGLMQLLPTTGRAVAAELGLRWDGPETLFDPVANVRLGVAYLERLRARYGNLSIALDRLQLGPDAGLGHAAAQRADPRGLQPAGLPGLPRERGGPRAADLRQHQKESDLSLSLGAASLPAMSRAARALAPPLAACPGAPAPGPQPRHPGPPARRRDRDAGRAGLRRAHHHRGLPPGAALAGRSLQALREQGGPGRRDGRAALLGADRGFPRRLRGGRPLPATGSARCCASSRAASASRACSRRSSSTPLRVRTRCCAPSSRRSCARHHANLLREARELFPRAARREPRFRRHRRHRDRSAAGSRAGRTRDGGPGDRPGGASPGSSGCCGPSWRASGCPG